MAIIGIDLGTTNSTCGIWRNGSVELIPNRLGEFLTPSVVGVDDNNKTIVGRVAKERLITHSDQTVAVFKRLMGTDHVVNLAKKPFTATELSAVILQSLKEDAEEFLGETVTEAVISVPAYFNDNQRQATKLAGELTGLTVNRLINEPTAAAMAYGLHDKQEGTFLVLDMGGGTFDVSLLEFFEGVMEVHASAGDNFLGGEDFVDEMVKDVLRIHQVQPSALSAQQTSTLCMQLETVKRNVDNLTNKTLTLQLGSKSVDWTVPDDWFAQVATPLLLRARKPIEAAFRDADMTASEIDNVILVGGSTRMKLFRTMVAKLFGRFPDSTIDPDLVVASGAAIQAGLISRDAALDDVVLTDVCPYTLGTAVRGPEGSDDGYFLPIIERNSIVPVSTVRRVQTAESNQTVVQIKIYQGENRLVSKNVFLGSFDVKIPKGPAGKESLDIRYSYDMNGLLEVDVTICSTGKVFSKLIDNTPGSLSEKEVEKTRKKLAKMKFHPREDEMNRMLMARGERIYEACLGEKRDYLSQVLAEFDKVLDSQNAVQIRKHQAGLQELLDQIDSEEWI
ncbi:Chaperone protein HscC [Sinobacterium norvegicum]|uniref:Chaperone protein HscC n=1 Tax=Sinobacterium norvegicum TaxID=1641715 RepID=A0ABN8EFJ3_9GAMM|nr:molecular chaperone HscC [Sinobacterium norvegicum]CAH0991173.1 Chaperone protein HscC [Sinobacterium norvegicum]